jgi:predicted PurR-regulated permease PerM
LARPAETRSKFGGWPLTAGITAVLVFLFFVRHILLPFILAAAVAFILTPTVDRLQGRGRVPRWTVAVLAYLCVVAALGILLYLAGGLVVREAADIVRNFPQLLQELLSEAAAVTDRLGGPPLDAARLSSEILREVQTLLGAGATLSLAGYGVAALFGTILWLVLLLYFLVSGKEIAAGAFWLIPPEYRREIDAMARKIIPLLRRYFVGLLVVVTYATAAAWIAFGPVFHVPRALLLAFVVGILELVPVIGPATSVGMVALTAIQQHSLFALTGLAAFAIALRISIDQFIGPLVLGRAARVHPVVIIFSFLSGAVLFGVIGLLLAVPVAASIKIILATYYSEPIDPARTRSSA